MIKSPGDYTYPYASERPPERKKASQTEMVIKPSI